MPSTRGFWRKRYRSGKVYYTRDPVTGRQISTGCRDLTAAKLYRARLEREAADPAHHPTEAEPYRLDRVVTTLIADRIRAGRSAGTLNVIECKTRHLVRLLGADCDTRKLSRRVINEYIDTRRGEGASRHTVSKEIVQFKSALKLRSGLPYQLKDVFLRYSDGYKPRETFLTKEQFWKLLDKLPASRRIDVIFFVTTGARLGEYQRAERKDITGKVVWLKGTKTKSAARSVPLLPELEQALAVSRRPWRGYLFDRWHNMHRDLKAACKAAGVPACGPNDFRRTYCTWLCEAGVPEFTAAALLGHTSSTMVRRVYGRTSNDAKLRAAVLLGSLAVPGSKDVSELIPSYAINATNETAKLRALPSVT